MEKKIVFYTHYAEIMVLNTVFRKKIDNFENFLRFCIPFLFKEWCLMFVNKNWHATSN